MLTIRIVTITGETVQLDVVQVEFIRICPYCEMPFRTISPDQKNCKPSHGVRLSERKAILRNSAITPPSFPSH